MRPVIIMMAMAVVSQSIVGCSPLRWENLPKPQTEVPVLIEEFDGLTRRAAPIIRKLVKNRPVPVTLIQVYSTRFHKLPTKEQIAISYRCGPGEPPKPYGCILIKDTVLKELSDVALTGLLAHELGHIELGHRTTPTASQLRTTEFDADDAAIARLTDAGYCGGPVMRQTFLELIKLTPGAGGGFTGERFARTLNTPCALSLP